MVTLPVRILELRSVRGTGGGPEKTILLGGARSDPCRYAVTVCYIRDSRDDVFHIDRRAGELPLDYVEVLEKHSLDPGIWSQLRALVRARRIDIVHAHDHKTDLLALLLSFAEPIVPLATAHGWAGHSSKERWLYHPGDRWLLARYPRAIVVSDEMRRALLRAGARDERITVIPNGIDHLAFQRNPERSGEARSAFELPMAAFVVGAVGRLEKEKNYPLLIRAFSRVAVDLPDARLVIAGDGSQRAQLEELIAAVACSDRIRLLGQVPDAMLLHHALDAFVMCSDNEGSPNAVLEAMAMMTPVIATDVGGIGDLARHGQEALLTARGDEAALADAIRNIFAEPCAARLRAEAARMRVERDLSFETRMRRVETIYDELMTSFPAVREGRRVWRYRNRA